mmetsp:Transcript_17837/g.49262  ORF Transcript_17837/g.49262 Transcript_17837/m.49262 type:complete len:241 (-) Transcript_17837:1423-2145(-)
MKSSRKPATSVCVNPVSLIAVCSLATRSRSCNSWNCLINRKKSGKSKLPLPSASASRMSRTSSGRMFVSWAISGRMSSIKKMSSLLSMSPLPSKSYRLNTCFIMATWEVENPPFFRKAFRAAFEARTAMRMNVLRSTRLPTVASASDTRKRSSEASSSSSSTCSSLLSECPKPIKAACACSLLIVPSSTASCCRKASCIKVCSLSRCIRISFRSSGKSSAPESSMSTLLMKCCNTSYGKV